jgi:hypothetical protein
LYLNDSNPNQYDTHVDHGREYAATNRSAPGASDLSLNGAPFGYAQAKTVPAGSTMPVNAGVVVTETVDDPGGPEIQAANTTDFHLFYSPPAGSEGALLVKTNGNATHYPTFGDWGCPKYG